MKKYITSDKVGQFVQALYESGKIDYIQVQGEQVSVKANGEYTFVEILQEKSYEDLVSEFTAEKAEEA